MGAIIPVTGPNTLASMKAMITRYHKEQEEGDLLTDAVNDAVESLWRSILLVSLGQFMQGPVTNLQIAAGAERAKIVSIADPTVAPITTETAGGTLASRTIDFTYTLVTESGSETLPSPIGSITTTLNFLAQCSPPAYVSGAIGWNVYACLHDGRPAKQNDSPLLFSTTYQEPEDTGIIDAPNLPSPPNENGTADNIFYIRLMQVQNPDGTYTTWQAGNIDDLLLLRASRSIAAASTYQSYAYDVLNGSQLEVRPAAGQTLTPRYFFVVKPRRMLYDNATLPFTNISATEFLKMYSDAKLDLSNHEYTGYNLKSSAAERIRLEIVQGLNTQATAKQRTITPYFSW
jgi:hypothetical protein